MKKPFPQHKVTLSEPFDAKKTYHQAGYDSFTTGSSFISLNEFLRERYKEVETGTFSDEIKRFMNKLHIMFSFDFNHLYFGGEEPKLDRKHVFYVTFPDTWSTQELVRLFSAFGNVSFGWLNNVSALVGLRDATKWKDAKKCFQKLPAASTHRVIPYADYLVKIKNAAKSVSSNGTRKSLVDNPVVLKENEQKEQAKRKMLSDDLTSEESTDTSKSKKNKADEDTSLKPFEESKEW